MTVRRPVSVLALAVAMLVPCALVACGSADARGGSGGTTPPGATTPPGSGDRPSTLLDQLDGRTFVSTDVSGAPSPLVKGSRIVVTFRDDSANVHAGCNSMSSPVGLDDAGRLVMAVVSMTEMACLGPLMDQDTWVAAFLTSGPRVRLNGPRLDLTSGATMIRLVDKNVADPARPLTGTSWVLTGYGSGSGSDASISSVPAGVMSTLRLEPLTGSTTGTTRATMSLGCNSGGGVAQLDGSRVRVTELISTQRLCGGAKDDVERIVRTVLTEGAAYAIDGGQLTLSSGAGTLTYQEGEPPTS